MVTTIAEQSADQVQAIVSPEVGEKEGLQQMRILGGFLWCERVASSTRLSALMASNLMTRERAADNQNDIWCVCCSYSNWLHQDIFACHAPSLCYQGV